MGARRLHVLLIIEQCNPEWTSVPLVGFRIYEALRLLADVTLVTHERNQAALARAGCSDAVTIPEGPLIRRFFQVVGRLTNRGGRVNWPLLHALGYPVYAEFNRKVFQRFGDAVRSGAFDVVHAFSPIVPRYPVRIVEACRDTPFILGPVNGGLAFPPAFQDIGRKEYDRFSFLRNFARFIPGYRRTYRCAHKILAGSTSTLDMLRQMFAIPNDRIEWFPENGVPAAFFGRKASPKPADTVGLLFVGRLVPGKCADVVIEALGQLPASVRERVALTIVGDGPERKALEEQAQALGLGAKVTFAGWVASDRTLEFYRQADIFCFPSIREFGGAVVLEAMAAGLPCIVADYGGIAEFVTEETGFKIAPLSRPHLVTGMTRKIETLVEDAALRMRMSAQSVERARTFEWGNKAAQILAIYERAILRNRASGNSHE